jgi:hypothetical protein
MGVLTEDAMKELESIVAAVVDGEPITLAAALRHARLKNGMEFLRRAADGILIQRAVEREQIRVEDHEVERLLPEVRGKTSLPEAEAREEVKKTIAFGKLKGLVTDRLRQTLGMGLFDELDTRSRGTVRDLLFLHWLKQERERAKVDLCLLREV